MVDTDETQSGEWHKNQPYGCAYIEGSDNQSFSHVWEASFQDGETQVQFVRILSHNTFAENNAYGITVYIDDQICGKTTSKSQL